ncbi:hypothetical protein FRC09_017104 [Ceratobasidium sp. 395]|nr:hypothetical protein FRC09_017104 [Ceratobasidium sp. 395]
MSNSLFNRVLNIPELAALFAKLLSRQDLAKLGRTSRNCFKITTKFVWREVWGVHNLLKLIHGTACTKRTSGSTWSLSLPNLNAADLTRFKHYAPHVTYLHILPQLQAKYQFSDWKKLAKYATTTLLLPNLQILAYESDSTQDDVFIRWITAFLSANVTTVHTHSVMWTNEVMVSTRRAETLLKAVSKGCTAITDLSFFPVDPYVWKSSLINEDRDLGDFQAETEFEDESNGNNRFYDYLRPMHDLKNLTTTSFIVISGAIEVLASLPNLKKLSLYCSFPNEYLVYQLSPKYPDHPFRSITALELLFPDMDCIRQVWSLAPLVNNLTEVMIRLRASNGEDDDYDDYDDDDEDDEFSSARNFVGFIPELCKRSPRVQKLIIDFDAAEGYISQALSLETLKYLVALPLQTLDLRHALLEQVSQACRILEQCGTLRNIHLQDQRVTYEHLYRYTKTTRNNQRRH